LAYHRIEDAVPAWRSAATRGPGAGKAGGQGIAAPGSDAARQLAAACLAWMSENGLWPNKAADMDLVTAEIAAGTRGLLTPPPQAAADGEIAPAAWAIPAAAGSGLGALIVSPLTGLWFDNKPIGFFAGGTLGAYLLVRGLAALLDRPRFVAALRTAATVSAGGVAVRGFWQVLRGQSLGWARSVLWLVAAPLVLQGIQPRPGAAGRKQGPATAAADDAVFLQAADLTLAIAWSHPDRLARRRDEPPAAAKPLPGPVFAALSQLRADITPDGSAEDIRESAEAMIQRFQEAGYSWKSVARGTPYAAEMAEYFDTFGAIPAGTPVRTQRPAVTQAGKMVHKGELRRV
jgi:hypothetical protein